MLGLLRFYLALGVRAITIAMNVGGKSNTDVNVAYDLSATATTNVLIFAVLALDASSHVIIRNVNPFIANDLNHIPGKLLESTMTIQW
jgi:hypothetical protein